MIILKIETNKVEQDVTYERTIHGAEQGHEGMGDGRVRYRQKQQGVLSLILLLR